VTVRRVLARGRHVERDFGAAERIGHELRERAIALEGCGDAHGRARRGSQRALADDLVDREEKARAAPARGPRRSFERELEAAHLALRHDAARGLLRVRDRRREGERHRHENH
jgi:hypothetical protein